MSSCLLSLIRWNPNLPTLQLAHQPSHEHEHSEPSPQANPNQSSRVDQELQVACPWEGGMLAQPESPKRPSASNDSRIGQPVEMIRWRI
jgi:hypothetical protein